MEKTITLTGLNNNKSKISFFSKDGSIDFSKGSTHIFAYFNGSLNPNIDIFAQLYILENNQPQTGVFEVYIPKNTNTAKIIISSSIHDVQLIDAKEF